MQSAVRTRLGTIAIVITIGFIYIVFFRAEVNLQQSPVYLKIGVSLQRQQQPKSDGESGDVRPLLATESSFAFAGSYDSALMSDSEPITSLGDCQKRVHTEYLTPKQLKVWLKQGSKGCERARCQFMNATNRPLVPLVSYPGSGNTWTRGLLEKATGICTGAVFFDPGLIKSGMVGEGVMNGAVVAVKMHSIMPQRIPDLKIEDKALLIVRNPFDTLVAEFTRQNSPGHTGTANSSLFINSTKWDDFVKNHSGGWTRLIETLITASRKDNFEIHFIRLENFKVDKLTAMERILQFLDFKYSRSDLAKRLQDDYDTFKRAHTDKDFEHYTEEQREAVNDKIKKLANFAEEQNLTEHLGFLNDYIRT